MSARRGNRISRLAPRSAAKGFTLLEVLIAMLVFAVGLLGIAGLQAAGMRFTQGSQFRGVALAQAESMVERMRANPRGVIAGAYHMNTRQTNYAKDCDAVACEAEELARYDLVVWEQGRADDPSGANQKVLPQGTGLVCRGEPRSDWTCASSGNINPHYTVSLRWVEQAASNSDSGGEDSGANASGNVTRTLTLQVTPYVDILADGL